MKLDIKDDEIIKKAQNKVDKFISNIYKSYFALKLQLKK